MHQVGGQAAHRLVRGQYPFALQNGTGRSSESSETGSWESSSAVEFEQFNVYGKFVTLVGERLRVLLSEMYDAEASGQTFRKVLGDQVRQVLGPLG